MGPRSELSDGLEPHDHFYMPGTPAVRQYQSGGREVVYPGWCGRVGTGEGYIPGTQPRSDLRLIYGILGLNRFILPFD